MDLHQIEEFITLATVRNFARAAEELFTTQATLSRHIAALEEELGYTLFYRTTRRVELTEFGSDFLPYAMKLKQAYEECQNWLASIAHASKNRLTVALANPISADVGIQRAFVDFSLKYPDYNIDLIQSDDEATLMERLRSRVYDAIIIREPLDTSDSFQHLPICPIEPLCLVLPKSHPLAEKELISLDLLKEEVFYLPPSASYSYKLFLARCEQLGFHPKIRNSLRGRDFALGVVKAGVGIPVLSKIPAMDFIDNTDNSFPISILTIDPPINQQINIVYPKIKSSSDATAKLIYYFKGLSLQ